MFATRSRPFRLIRILLSLAAIVGVVCSIRHNQKLAQLRQTHSELREQVGFLEVEDPTKVAISFVPASDDVIPPGVSQAYVWRYRIHIPANYGPSYWTQRGLVKADSPQGRGGSSSSWSGSSSEPKEVLATMALIQSDGKWMYCRTSEGSSSTSHMPDGFDIDSLDDLVIDTSVSAKDATRIFETDEAICLMRLREKNLAKNRNGDTEKDLYRGFAAYLYSSKHKDAFTAWASGKADSMREVNP